jgi:ABC-type multidrug transport system fused ATPase/permease subunit
MVQCKIPITFKYIIINFIKQHKFLFICYVLLVLLVPVQDVGIPHIVGMLTQSIQKKKTIFFPLALLISITVLLQAGSILSGMIEIKMFPSFQKFVREIMMNHIMKQSKTNYEELRTGEITMHLHKLPSMLYSYIEDMRDMIIPQFIVYIVAIAYFARYDIKISIALFIVLIALFISVKQSLSKCSAISESRDSKYNEMMEEITDVMKNITSVLNANTEQKETARNNLYQEDYYVLSRKSLRCAYSARYYLIPIVLGFFSWSLVRMYHFVKINKIKSHTMVSLVLILLYIMKSMWIVIYNMKDQVIRWGSIQSSLKIFNDCAPEEDKSITRQINPQKGFVLKNITYGYVGRKKIFDNLDLDILPNQKTLIVGEIGSGKSTIIKLLMKYQIPQQGTIYYNGVPYSSISVEDIRETIGYVPQTPILFNRSIYENITYNNSSITESQVIQLMEELGLSDMLKKFPEGLKTNVGNGGSKLSGGQRQIVWILRVMLQNPEVVILDEPTSALDENTKPIVQKMLEQIIQNKTTIMITHDQFLYKLSDRIIELKNGKFVDIKKS